MLPNFIFIGPDKTGSTWIYESLKLHPEVCVAKAKDIYFFDKFFSKGVAWYESMFSHCKGKKAAGEVSHDYLFSEDACKRIHKIIPNVKLITCLRNPVERAFSAYLFLVRHGITTDDFFTSIKRFPEIIHRSCYAEPLKKYISTFGRGHILILRFDDLENNPLNFVSQIYKFIGVDATYKPEEILHRKVLPAAKPRNLSIAFITKQLALFVRHIGFPNIVGKVKQSPFVQKLLYVPYEEKNRPTISGNEKKYLQKFFEPHITALENLLGEGFNEWKK